MVDPLTTAPLAEKAASGAEAAREARLRETARDLESAFVAEMLKQAGIAEAFGAGASTGADEFSSFLLEAVAEEMADNGALGLAEKFYQQLRLADTGHKGGEKL